MFNVGIQAKRGEVQWSMCDLINKQTNKQANK